MLLGSGDGFTSEAAEAGSPDLCREPGPRRPYQYLFDGARDRCPAFLTG